MPFHICSDELQMFMMVINNAMEYMKVFNCFIAVKSKQFTHTNCHMEGSHK